MLLSMLFDVILLPAERYEQGEYERGRWTFLARRSRVGLGISSCCCAAESDWTQHKIRVDILYKKPISASDLFRPL